MDRVRKIFHKDDEITIVDYSGARENEMIATVEAASNRILHEGKETLVLSIFNNKNYVTPKFMRQVEATLKKADHLIVKNAVIGLSSTQQWILKGVNLWYKKKIYHFDSEQEALNFLISQIRK